MAAPKSVRIQLGERRSTILGRNLVGTTTDRAGFVAGVGASLQPNPNFVSSLAIAQGIPGPPPRRRNIISGTQLRPNPLNERFGGSPGALAEFRRRFTLLASRAQEQGTALGSRGLLGD